MVSLRISLLVALLGNGSAQPPKSETGSRQHDLQVAIDRAEPGATVDIAPGVYLAGLVIRKKLTLRGAGPDRTILASKASHDLIQIFATEAVTLSNLRIHSRAQLTSDVVDRRGIVAVKRRAKLHLTACVIDGGPASGIVIEPNATSEVHGSLIANVGSVGVFAAQGPKGWTRIIDSELRDCGYAGVQIPRGGASTTVERCRITGSGYHGIRYDHCAPQVTGNRFSGNKRTAIYASGKTRATILHNTFLGHPISCWFENHDTIASNTFAGETTGIWVLGESKPRILKNIFYRCAEPIRASAIAARNRRAQATRRVDATDNLLFMVDTTIITRTKQDLLDGPGNRSADPMFQQPETRDYRLADGSIARKCKIGAMQGLPMRSQWPPSVLRPVTSAELVAPRKKPKPKATRAPRVGPTVQPSPGLGSSGVPIWSNQFPAGMRRENWLLFSKD